MALVTTLLSSVSGSGGSGSVNGVVLSPVLAASTAALTVTYANGSAGIGATLTNAGAQAAFSLDGISPGAGGRVMIKDQASGLQNGIYSVTTVGTGATNWVLTRTSDFDEPGEMSVGVSVIVATGTVNGATLWEQTATVAAVGTDTITFTEVANATLTSATIGNINIAANTISSTNAGGDIVLTPATTGQVEFGANSTKASRTRWREDTDNGTNYITWGAPASLAGNTDYDYPSAYPPANGEVMTSTTTGVTSWANPATVGGWVYLATATASASASIAFTGLTSAYIAYKVIFTGYAPATDATEIWLRTSTDGGSNYDAGASDYAFALTYATMQVATVVPAAFADEADSAIALFSNHGNAANELSAYEVTIFNPSAATYCSVEYKGYSTDAIGLLYMVTGSGVRLTAADVDAIQFLSSSGNIATGEFRLFGLKGA